MTNINEQVGAINNDEVGHCVCCYAVFAETGEGERKALQLLLSLPIFNTAEGKHPIHDCRLQ